MTIALSQALTMRSSRRELLVQSWRPVALLGVALPTLYMAWTHQGLVYPDEIYQSLEQAHRLVFGAGLIPREFEQGSRSWLFAGVLAALLKVGSWFGVSSGLCVARLAKCAMALLSTLTCWSAMRLARELAGQRAEVLTALWFATLPMLLVFDGRCFSEVASAPLVVEAVLLVVACRRTPGRLAAAGALAGVAVFVRYQTGLVAACLFLGLVAARRWRDLRWFASAAALIGLLGGLLDWLTWGSPYASLARHVGFNLIEGKASNFGVSPATFYVDTLVRSSGWAILIPAVGLLCSLRRAPLVAGIVLVFVGAHMLEPHKELRFILPVVPVALAAAASGLTTALDRIQWPTLGLGRVARWVPWAIGGATALAFLCAPPQTLERIGYKGTQSVWHASEESNVLMSEAGEQADACGVMVTAVSRWAWGGYSYLHRDVPMFSRAGSHETARANYLVAPRGRRLPAHFHEVDEMGTTILARRDGPCAASEPTTRY